MLVSECLVANSYGAFSGLKNQIQENPGESRQEDTSADHKMESVVGEGALENYYIYFLLLYFKKLYLKIIYLKL